MSFYTVSSLKPEAFAFPLAPRLRDAQLPWHAVRTEAAARRAGLAAAFESPLAVDAQVAIFDATNSTEERRSLLVCARPCRCLRGVGSPSMPGTHRHMPQTHALCPSAARSRTARRAMVRKG